MIVHVVLKGLRNEKLKSEILQITYLNMEKMMATCAKYESAERTLEEFAKGEEEVSGVTKRGKGRKGKREIHEG